MSERTEQRTRRRESGDTSPSLLSLLKEGCRVEFPNEYILIGYPEDGYIQCAYINGVGIVENDGLHHLTKEGLEKALSDVDNYEQDDE